MKRILAIALAAMVIGTGIYMYRQPDFDIDVPNEIVLEMGERFLPDDYVSVEGNTDGMTLEYKDNINTNKEGTYTLTIKAEDSKGRIKETTVAVIVRDSAK
ncbi:MAG: DUF5011 domain-containing protein [Clostridiales bacterium]|nr:DUF5011 domain-containing protein [Clostridiales bacterium]